MFRRRRRLCCRRRRRRRRRGSTDPVRLTVRSTLCVLAKRRGRVSNKERFRSAHCRHSLRKRFFLALKLKISLNIDYVIDVVAVLMDFHPHLSAGVAVSQRGGRGQFGHGVIGQIESFSKEINVLYYWSPHARLSSEAFSIGELFAPLELEILSESFIHGRL